VLTGPHIRVNYGAHVDVIDHDGHLVVVPIRSQKDKEVAPDART
jgi:hypothetical protein